jgi:cold shock protein
MPDVIVAISVALRSTRRTRGAQLPILSFRIPLFRRWRPNQHARTRGFAGSRRRGGAQQIGDPLEDGEHALVLVGHRRRPGRGYLERRAGTLRQPVDARTPGERGCRSAPVAERGSSLGRSTMVRGTVKWFNPTKGYGFIQPQGGGSRDVFVHISAVERAGLSSLNEGQQIEYEIEENRGKMSAVNLKVK